jgi:hypothetical protein
MLPEELEHYEHILRYNKIPKLKTKKFNTYYKELKCLLHHLVGDSLLEYAIYYYAVFSEGMKAEMIAYLAATNQDYRSSIKYLELSNKGLSSVISELKAGNR